MSRVHITMTRYADSFELVYERRMVVRSDGSYREFSDQPTAERVARVDSEAGYDVKIIKV